MRRRPEPAHLGGRREQRCGLGPDEQVVLLLGEQQPVVRQQLAHLPDRHLVGDPRQHAQRLEVVEPDQLDHRARVEVVSHDHGDLVAEERVDRRHPAPQHRMVHRVVVHQRGDVDQLDHRGQRHRPVLVPPGGLVGQQHQRRAEELPAGLQEVGVHLRDEPEVGLDDAPDLVRHPGEALGNRRLEVGQRHRRGRGSHAPPPASRPRRSFRSRKPMSTASARW